MLPRPSDHWPLAAAAALDLAEQLLAAGAQTYVPVKAEVCRGIWRKCVA